MLYENEKEIRYEKIHTWDLLEEVDRLLKHVPEWHPFKWDPITQQKYQCYYKKKFGYTSINKKKI